MGKTNLTGDNGSPIDATITVGGILKKTYGQYLPTTSIRGRHVIKWLMSKKLYTYTN